MEFTTKKNNNATCHLNLSFSATEVENAYQKAYDRAKAKAKIPGFRPGKAPLALVEKALGESVMGDAANVLIDTAMAEIFPKLEPKPIRYPRFQVDSFDRKSGAKASATYDTKPEVELPKLSKIKIATKRIKVQDLDIQRELEAIQKGMARNVLKEDEAKIEANDLVEFEYRFRSEGSDFSKDPLQGKYQLGAKQNPPGFDSELLGLTTSETKEFSYTYPEAYPQSPENQGKTYVYQIKPGAIYNVTFPPIDDDLASEYDGSENLKSLQAKIQATLENQASDLLKRKALEDAYSKILKETKFVIPEGLILEEIEGVFQNFAREIRLPKLSLSDYAKKIGKTDEEVRESFRSIAEKRIQIYLVRIEIGQKQGIAVSSEEMSNGFQKEAESQQVPTEALLEEVKKQKAELFYRDKFLFEKVDAFVWDSIDKKSSEDLPLSELDAYLKGDNK